MTGRCGTAHLPVLLVITPRLRRLLIQWLLGCAWSFSFLCLLSFLGSTSCFGWGIFAICSCLKHTPILEHVLRLTLQCSGHCKMYTKVPIDINLVIGLQGVGALCQNISQNVTQAHRSALRAVQAEEKYLQGFVMICYRLC